MKRIRGNGSLYRQKGSRFWWIAYYRSGKLYRKSSGKTTKTEAARFLQCELAAIRSGQRDPDTDKTRVAELLDDLVLDYRINGRASLHHIEGSRLTHIKPYFAHLRASEVTTTDVQRYIEERQKAGAANATINRELAALKRAFNLGLRCTPPKVIRVPYIPKLKEDNVRTGFLDNDQYASLAEATSQKGLWLRSIFEVGYVWGWRISEALNLKVKQVDLSERLVRLNPGETKNGRGRVAKMTDSLHSLLAECVRGKNADDFVFSRAGKRVRDFRGAWRAACEAAGVPNLLFHDLRRTAVRNMVRAGIPEHQAMMISGHKTRVVFDRYDIVNENDLAIATKKLQAFHVAQTQNPHSVLIERHDAAPDEKPPRPN